MTPLPASDAPRLSRTLPRIALALLAVGALYGIDIVCTTTVSPASAHTFATNVAMPFDLVVFVPLVFYLLVVRRLHITPILVLPVIALGVAISSQFVDASQPSLLVPLAIAAPVVDIAVGIREGRRLLTAFRDARTHSTRPLDWFSAAAGQLVQHERVAHMVALECSIWWYLLRSWRRTPDIPEGSRAFTCHRASGYVALTSIILVVCAIEAIAVHLLVMQWSAVAAAMLTLATVYSAVWIAGETRAVVLNPLLVDEDNVTLRWGASFSEHIPLALIERIETVDEPSIAKTERLNMSVMGARPCWVVFSHPIEVHTFTGGLRAVRAINVSPDDRAAFIKAVQK